jgi:hypothetical protein
MLTPSVTYLGPAHSPADSRVSGEVVHGLRPPESHYEPSMTRARCQARRASGGLGGAFKRTTARLVAGGSSPSKFETTRHPAQLSLPGPAPAATPWRPARARMAL